MNTINNRITEIKDQIAELVERLEENGSYSLSFYEEYSDDFADRCLEDMIYDWVDSQVSIYYSSLWSWVREEVDAPDYIQRAVAEGHVDTANFNIYEAIKSAQYLFYSDEVFADFKTLEELHKLHQELAELEREQVA